MGLMKKYLVIVGAMVICFAGAGPAGAVFIDFEDLSANTVVTNQYSSLGVTFSLLNGPTIPGPLAVGPILDADYVHSSGIVLWSGDDNLFDLHNDIQMTFSPMVNYVSFWALDCDEPLTVRSYQGSSLIQQNFYSPGSNLQEYLVVLGNIFGTGLFFDRVVIDVVEGQIGSFEGGPEYFDNLTFASINPQPPSVPVPGTLILFGSGLLCLAGLIKRIK
jgi:hypothetical protein